MAAITKRRAHFLVAAKYSAGIRHQRRYHGFLNADPIDERKRSFKSET
jgi:hypothetical protein